MILIAEDDAVQRIALARVLERGGFEVLEAENGVSAIALACAHLPDVMILDAVMPQMGGFEAIAAIRSRPGLSTTPAIVVSGLEDVESRVNALAIGADDFIVKPFDHRELLARVHAQLRVIDAWHGRLSAMTSDFREIRRRITESDRVTSPTDTARSLQAQFPEELGCGTLMIVDSTGHHEWGHQPFYPEDIVELDLLDPATRPGNTTAGGKNSDACPLCGAGTGGILLTRDAGSWANGRAVLVLGCADRPISEIQVLADEVAEACRTVFSERMRDWESDLELEAWLEQTIESKAFRIVFQPIVDMRSGRVIAQEALARFDDGTAPGEVFRAAVVLDRRVQLEVALVGLALDQAVALPDGVRIHVNVSPATAMTPEIRDLVATSTRRVVLEITENALFSSSNAETLRGSIPASCLLAADDVGAGYAGMAQLLEYRPDIVKIDRAVVTRIDRDPARQALVAGLVQYAQATRSFVIAEGIERSEEWQQLCELGVDFGQGYLFARPVGLAEAAQMAYCTRGEAAPAKRGKLRQLISS
jgi:EAL domain-containing protein (putative c-di-GMP-specific phosphodiesterase class I)/DNA-binding NarL/FixJ family response regulator